MQKFFGTKANAHIFAGGLLPEPFLLRLPVFSAQAGIHAELAI
jgi:hypothetical protein